MIAFKDPNLEDLQITIQAVESLADFGEQVLSQQWLTHWESQQLNRTDPNDRDLFMASLLLISHTNEMTRAIAYVLGYGLGKAGFGLLGPAYSLLRSQLECYWNLSYMIKDSALRQRSCIIYMVAYSNLLYRRQVKNLSLAATEAERQLQVLDAQLASSLPSPHYDQAKQDYRAAQTEMSRKYPIYPEWYQVYKVADAKGSMIRPTIYHLALAADHQHIYNDEYSYWSAVSHGQAPYFGVTLPSGPPGYLIMGADILEARLIAIYAASRAYTTYRLLIDNLLGSKRSREFNQYLTTVQFDREQSLAQFLLSPQK